MHKPKPKHQTAVRVALAHLKNTIKHQNSCQVSEASRHRLSRALWTLLSGLQRYWETLETSSDTDHWGGQKLGI